MSKKHYLIYQIINTVNNKIYIGKHITENIDDDYFGSGKYLKHAQKKYGLDKFVKTILFELQNKEEMDLLEKCVVTKEFCDRDDTYNINVGGDGGWYHLAKNPKYHGNNAWMKNKSVNDLIERQKKSAMSNKKRIQNMSIKQYNLFIEQCRQNTKEWNAKHPGYFAGERNPMYGHVDSEETRQKKIISHLGSKNNQYGKMWICNDETKESKTIKKTDPIPFGWRKGRICKIKSSTQAVHTSADC